MQPRFKAVDMNYCMSGLY